MGFALPNELLREIFLLTSALRIEDETFTDTHPLSHSYHLDRSPALAVLSTCKHWRRVAQPLVYETVILRSKPQTRSFLYTLTKYPSCRQFVLRLRIEGGFSPNMTKILPLLTHLREIYISLAITSKDTVTGLCAGLESIDPVRCIVYDPPDIMPANKALEQLFDTMCRRIPLWSNLRHFRFPYDYFEMSYMWMGVGGRLRGQRALRLASNLEVLCLPRAYHITGLVSFIVDALETSNLKAIHSELPYNADFYGAQFKEAVASNVMLQGLFHFPLPGPWVNRPYGVVDDAAHSINNRFAFYLQ